MQRTITKQLRQELAEILIRMHVPREMSLEILTAIETPEELMSFLDKFTFEMTPEEVYQVAVEAIRENQCL